MNKQAEQNEQVCTGPQPDRQAVHLPKCITVEPAGDPIIRPEIVAKAFKTLSADAQRGDGSLTRGDVDRIYFRYELSITECMATEEKLKAASFTISEDHDDTQANSKSTGRNPSRFLSEAEEKELGRRIQLAHRIPSDRENLDPAYVERIQTNARHAKSIFVTSNIRYVEKLARHYNNQRHLAIEDIQQEGYIGLLKAADLYDPERGFRFKTYATWWILQQIRRAIADRDRMIRLPVHVHDQIAKVRRASAKLTFAHGQPPTPQELANALGMKPEKLMELLWRTQITDVTEGDLQIGDEDSLLSKVADSAQPTIDALIVEDFQKQLRKVLNRLSPREARILRLRFGIDCDGPYTLESIGHSFNLTRERIRQLEAKALKKLRHINQSSELIDFLDS